MFYTTIILLLILLVVLKTFKVVPAHQTMVKERLGKFNMTLEPGFHFLIPFFDKIAYQHDIREQVIDIPSQNCITKDNIQVEVDGVVYLKVMDVEKASYGIGDYKRASINLAQTTMRSEIGKMDLDHTFSERDAINENIVREIDLASDPWGIKVLRYEIKNISPSNHMIETMEKQMEAERQKRAAITQANGEKEATINLSTADRQEKINLSEGERQSQINLAEGKAEEISSLAEATAFSVKRISEAMAKPGGKEALKVKLVEQFIEEFGRIVDVSKVTVVPSQLANIKGLFEGIGKITEQKNKEYPV
jgi:regulator of protease activity HflC (stomatin/prohibitin superfamily)